MKKQKIKIIIFICVSLASQIFIGRVSANGGATVSWVAPTTNEDSSVPVDLSGYRIFYSTSEIDCTAWDAATIQADRKATALGSVVHVDVSEANTLRDSGDAAKRGYTFNTGNLLNPGAVYYFTVVAYDSSGNFSKCVSDSGSNKTASKLIYHVGNLKNSDVVGLSDLDILAGDFNKTSFCRIANHPSDINGDCTVNLSDLSILAGEYGL